MVDVAPVGGFVAPGGVEKLLSAYDFEVERMTAWAQLLEANPSAKGVHDYANGRRVSIRARAVGRSPTTTVLSARQRMRRVACDFRSPALTRRVKSRRWG